MDKNLLERRARFVYEGARLAAQAANAPIIPFVWEMREEAFKSQFCKVIERQCGDKRSCSAEELNVARAGLGLPELPVAEHNLYLHKNFFEHPQLRPYISEGFMTSPNFLSTHYYVSRVMHPLFDKGKPFTRNSEFVNFFSEALNNVGDYSPIKIYAFEKIG